MKSTISFKTKKSFLLKKLLVSLGLSVSALSLFTLPSVVAVSSALPPGITVEDLDNNSRKMLTTVPKFSNEFATWLIELENETASRVFSTGPMFGKNKEEIFEANKKVVGKLLDRIREDMEFVALLIQFLKWTASGLTTFAEEKNIYFLKTRTNLSGKILESLLNVGESKFPPGFLRTLVKILDFGSTSKFLSVSLASSQKQAAYLSEKVKGNFSGNTHVYTPEKIAEETNKVWLLNQRNSIEDFKKSSGGIDWWAYYHFLRSAWRVANYWGKTLASWFPVKISRGQATE